MTSYIEKSEASYFLNLLLLASTNNYNSNLWNLSLSNLICIKKWNGSLPGTHARKLKSLEKG